MKWCNSMLHLVLAYFNWKMWRVHLFPYWCFCWNRVDWRTNRNTSDFHHQHWLQQWCTMYMMQKKKNQRNKVLDSLSLFIEVNFIEIFDTFHHYPKSHMTSGKNIFSRFIQEMIMYLNERCALNAQKFVVFFFFFILLKWNKPHTSYTQCHRVCMLHISIRGKNAFCEMRHDNHMNQ